MSNCPEHVHPVNVLWHSRSMRGSGLNNEWRIRATDRFRACIYYATLTHHAPGCCECAQDSWTLQWIRGKKNYINTVQFLAQTDCFVSYDLNVSSRAAGFNLVVSVYSFFTLKAMGPIDYHYIWLTVWVKHLCLCSTEEIKSPTSWKPWGYADKHVFFFLGGGELSL